MGMNTNGTNVKTWAFGHLQTEAPVRRMLTLSYLADFWKEFAEVFMEIYDMDMSYNIGKMDVSI